MGNSVAVADPVVGIAGATDPALYHPSGNRRRSTHGTGVRIPVVTARVSNFVWNLIFWWADFLFCSWTA